MMAPHQSSSLMPSRLASSGGGCEDTCQWSLTNPPSSPWKGPGRHSSTLGQGSFSRSSRHQARNKACQLHPLLMLMILSIYQMQMNNTVAVSVVA